MIGVLIVFIWKVWVVLTWWCWMSTLRAPYSVMRIRVMSSRVFFSTRVSILRFIDWFAAVRPNSTPSTGFIISLSFFFATSLSILATDSIACSSWIHSFIVSAVSNCSLSSIAVSCSTAMIPYGIAKIISPSIYCFLSTHAMLDSLNCLVGSEISSCHALTINSAASQQVLSCLLIAWPFAMVTQISL